MAREEAPQGLEQDNTTMVTGSSSWETDSGSSAAPVTSDSSSEESETEGPPLLAVHSLDELELNDFLMGTFDVDSNDHVADAGTYDPHLDLTALV